MFAGRARQVEDDDSGASRGTTAHAPVSVPALDVPQGLSGTRYQPIDPGTPLNGPTTQLVIQPPRRSALNNGWKWGGRSADKAVIAA